LLRIIDFLDIIMMLCMNLLLTSYRLWCDNH